MGRKPDISRYELLGLIMPEARVYSFDETCKLLDVCPDTLRDLITEGKLRAYKVPEGTGNWKISELAIRDYNTDMEKKNNIAG
jgi:excisionase family DNA binding protein